MRAAGAAGLAGRRQLGLLYSGERMMLSRCPLAPDVWRAFVTAGRLSGGRPVAGNGDYSRLWSRATSTGLVDSIIMRVVDIMLACRACCGAGAGGDLRPASIGNAALALTFVALPHYVANARRFW